MAEIRPFQGLRYAEKAGPIEKLVAPPYDVIQTHEHDALADRSPYNVVHLTLPEEKPDDRSKFVKYARSAALLAEWRKEGILEPESRSAFYRYRQTFEIPYLSREPFTRTAVIAALKIEPYEKGVVLPHEQTFPKHKEDRLRLLEATRAHLECIFGLYEDRDDAIGRVLASEGGNGLELTSDDHVTHLLEPITDSATCAKLAELMRDKKIWIADGHHRYETALAFRASMGDRPVPVAEDYMMVALSSMSDPGLVLLPTHRVLKTSPVSTEELVSRMESVFAMEEMHTTHLFDRLRQAGAEGKHAFGLSVGGGRGYLLTAHSADTVAQLVGDEGSKALRELDVAVLHRAVFDELLGVADPDSIFYTRDAAEALLMVDEGAAAAFLMNPPTIDDMRTIALGGEKMPQKSTYYFPKILSGLVLWSLSDF